MQLVTALEDQALTWYIKYCSDNPNATLAKTQRALNKEFRKPKSEAQSLTEFKKIQQKIDETPWDFDQRLKFLIKQTNMVITDSQHHDWYIVSLLPHLRVPLSQQKIATQEESLEIVMMLDALSI